MKISNLILLLLLSIAQVTYARADDSELTAGLPDVVHLRSGGTLHGKIISEERDETDGRKYVVIETNSGGLLKLDAARLVRKTEPADLVDAEYRRRLKIAGDDPNLIWKVYQWCQDQPSGSHRFKDDLKFLLERIAKLDANDERSRRLLGYDLVGGQWLYKPSLFDAHGYSRDGTSWSPNLQSSVDEKLEQQNALVVERKKAFNVWLRNVKQPGFTRAELTKQLFDICDQIAVPIIMEQQAKTEPNPQMRLLYVEAFGRVPSFAANQALCFFAIDDPDVDVRERALTLLGQDHFDHEASARLMSGHLRATNPVMLKRAAFAIGELGATGAMMALIEALETKQVVTQPGAGAGRMSLAFGSNGTGLQTGGEPQQQELLVKNEESRVALKKLTQQDYGFDAAAWKRWYLINYTLHDVRVRADD